MHHEPHLTSPVHCSESSVGASAISAYYTRGLEAFWRGSRWARGIVWDRFTHLVVTALARGYCKIPGLVGGVCIESFAPTLFKLHQLPWDILSAC